LKTPSSLRHPLWIYVFVALVAFWRVLFGGQTYFANDLIGWFGPMREYLRSRLAQGDLPLWNPYLFGGQPYLADPQTMVLYPLNYLTLFFPVATGLSLFFAIHMVLAGWGMHRWLKALKVSDRAAYAGGLLFCLSAFFWWELIHPPVLAAFAWLPWLFAALEDLSRDAAPRRAFWAGFAWSQVFLAGAIQVSLGAFYGGLLYFLVRARRVHGDKTAWKGWFSFLRAKARPILAAALLFGLGATPLLLQLAPTLEFSRLSTRGSEKMPYDTFNANYSMRPGTIGQFLFPTYPLPKGQTLETAIQTLSGDRADCDYFANFGFLGVWAPLLAFLAFRRRDRLAWLLGGLALASLLTAFGRYFPFHRIVTLVLPGIDLIQVAFRFIYLYTLAVCALVGLGYHWLEKRIEEGGRDAVLSLAPWVWAGVLLLAALTRPEATSREVLAGLLPGAAGLLLLRSPSFRRIGHLFLITALVLPNLLMGWDSFGTGSRRNLDFEKRTPDGFLTVIREAEPFRVFVGGDVPYPIEVKGQLYRMGMPANLSSALPYKTFVGYNPLRLKGMSELMDLPFHSLMYLTATRSIIQAQDMGDPKGFLKRNLGDLWIYDLDPHPAYV